MKKRGCEAVKKPAKKAWRENKNRKAQVTIFIIVAVLIVALAGLIYFLYPKISSPSVSSTPTGFIQNCLQEELKNTIEDVSLNGGTYNPELYFGYQEKDIAYLCYSNEQLKKCVVQQPMLRQHMEDEIKKQISEKVSGCFNSLEEEYKNKGYDVSLTRESYEVIIEPKRINLKINYPLTISKESSNDYDEFDVFVNSNLYNFILISNRIIEWEVNYGDADITSYMNYYSWLKAEKIRMSEGTRIYILTDRDTQDKFRFASRSMAMVKA